MLVKFKDVMQRFGGAMFVPIMLFPAAGLLLGFTVILSNADLFPWAIPGSNYMKVVSIFLQLSLVVFSNMPLIFVLGLPIALANKASGRAVLASFISYYTFNYFVGNVIKYWHEGLGVHYAVGTTGLTSVGGVLTLDTSIIGAIIVSSLTVYIHNKFFSKELPTLLSIFSGTPLVVVYSFPIMIALGIVTVFVWPSIQHGISSLQHVMIASGSIGVWIFTFCERFLIPTGLHHLIYSPIFYGPVAVDGGTVKYWALHLNEYAQSTQSLKELFPAGGYMLTGMAKVFVSLGAGLAIYSTAKPKNKKIVLGLIAPAVITAMLTGITEPIDFTFLFVAPVLFLLHALLSATMASILYGIGLVGNFQTGLVDFMFQNWIPLIKYHHTIYIIQILVGLGFTGIYFFIFRFLILKFNFMTPGRADDEAIQLKSKKEYKNAKKSNEKISKNQALAMECLALFGGAGNIESATNCATRLRVKVINADLVADGDSFKQAGALGFVQAKDNNFQVIIGMTVPQVRTEFDQLLK